jgi:hypothetical protein
MFSNADKVSLNISTLNPFSSSTTFKLGLLSISSSTTSIFLANPNPKRLYDLNLAYVTSL